MAHPPGSEQKRLEALIGRWKTEGRTREAPGAAAAFSDDGNKITGHWELLHDDSNWRPWMDITLTRQAS
jgi:hypothetical protein